MRRTLVVLAALACFAAAPAAAQGSTVFRSPSGAITCTLDARLGASCYNDRSLATESDEDCGNSGSAVTVTARGRARLVSVCNPFDVGGTRVTTLAYGDRLRAGRYVCTSRKTGMDCRNARTRHGFLLNRDGWRLR